MPFAPLTDENAILLRARDCLDTVKESYTDQREEMRKNLEFSLNDMWSAEAKAARQGKRPMYVFNTLDRIVDSISGNARQNPISIGVVPVDGRTDKFSAWIKEGIVRAIQYRSESQRSFSWALECASRLCEGFFRLRVDYESDRSMHPHIVVERVPDPFMCGIDPRSSHPTGADADYCFTLEKFNREEFSEAFGPDAVPVDVDLDQRLLDKWYEATSKDAITIKKYLVMEFYWKERLKKWIGEDEYGHVLDLEGDPVDTGEGTSWGMVGGQWVPILQSRQVDTYRIRGAFVCGHKVLTPAFEWYGKHLPLYRVPGKEVIGDGQRFVKSAISNARDGNRVLNTMVTSAAEVTNANVKGKWIGAWKSVRAHWARFWTDAGDPSKEFLPYDSDPALPNGGEPKWVSPPVQIQGQFQLVEQAIALQRYTTSAGEESTGLKSNATSGRQELVRVEQSATASMAFPDNLAFAVEDCARDILRLLPIYYRGTRQVQAILEEDSAIPKSILLPLGQPMDPETEEELRELAEAKKIPIPEMLEALELHDAEDDVRVRTGKSWVTRRMESQEFIMGVLQYIPQDYVGEIVDLIFENADAPGASQIAERLAKVKEKREKAAEMGSAADQAVQSLMQNPMIARAIQSLTQKTVRAYLEGQQAMDPNAAGLPAPDGMEGQEMEGQEMEGGMPEGMELDEEDQAALAQMPPEMRQGLMEQIGMGQGMAP